MYAPFSDKKVYSDQYNDVNGRVNTSSAISTPFGHLIGTRTASNAHAIYRNGSSVASTTNSGGSLSSISGSVTVFRAFTNEAGYTLGGYSIGSGLSSTDASNYYTDMQTFQTAMGRNV